MDVEIRPVHEDEFEPWVRAVEWAFGDDVTAEELDVARPLFEADRTLGAFDGGQIVGGAGAASMELTVPGGLLPVAGIVSVGVLPTHRRRGVARTLMRRQLEDIHAHGDALAVLWATEGSIYGRYGYGIGAFTASINVRRGRSAFASPHVWSGRMHLLERDAAVDGLRAVYEDVRREIPGFPARTPAWWDFRLFDSERERGDYGPYFFALHEGSGGIDGYALYRVKHDWTAGSPTGVLQLEELVATNALAYADVWRYVLDIDLVDRIESWKRPADEPLQLLLADPRALDYGLKDGLWLRLVDVPAALAGRRYAAEGRLRLEVRDAFCPWNEGRYEVRFGDGAASCEVTGADPDIVVDAAHLASTYLGAISFSRLAAAGLAGELRPGALRLADAMFSWHRAPWCPAVF